MYVLPTRSLAPHNRVRTIRVELTEANGAVVFDGLALSAGR